MRKTKAQEGILDFGLWILDWMTAHAVNPANAGIQAAAPSTPSFPSCAWERTCSRSSASTEFRKRFSTQSVSGNSVPKHSLGTRAPLATARDKSKIQNPKSKIAFAVALVLLVAPAAFAAGSFDSRLSKAHSMLANGDAEGAISAYHELQTEDPESEVLYYSMGCAQYKQGGKLIEQKAPKDAVDNFKSAQESFAKALNAKDPVIRKNAQYDHANATAQIAMNTMNAQQYEESKQAFEEAVKEYESFLKQNPDHQEARKNLDHVRYLLKSLLQNPPKQQEGQGDQNKDNKGQDKKQDQQKQGQQNQQQDGQDQQKKDEDKKQDDQGDKDKDKKQDTPEQQQGQAGEQDNQDQQQQKDAAEQKPDDKQNVEAILQSLEDTDKREQKDEKNVRTSVETSKDWW